MDGRSGLEAIYRSRSAAFGLLYQSMAGKHNVIIQDLIQIGTGQRYLQGHYCSSNRCESVADGRL